MKLILIFALFSLIIYAFHKDYFTTKIIEGNSRNCGKGKTYCGKKKKCISIWQETCD